MNEQQRIKEALEQRNEQTKIGKWKEGIQMSRQQKYEDTLEELGIDRI